MTVSVACFTTLSTDTITVSSDKYPSLTSAPLVSQQQLGSTGKIHQQFTQSFATAECQSASQSLIPSASHEIAGLLNATAGKSLPIISAAGTPHNSAAGTSSDFPCVCNYCHISSCHYSWIIVLVISPDPTCHCSEHTSNCAPV